MDVTEQCNVRKSFNKMLFKIIKCLMFNAMFIKIIKHKIALLIPMIPYSLSEQKNEVERAMIVYQLNLISLDQGRSSWFLNVGSHYIF